MVLITKPLTGPAHSKSNRYGTPPDITATIRSFLTKPLFDPCPWNPLHNGLHIDWKQSVFLNPPYSAGQLDLWEAKASLEVCKGNTQEIVWLINYGCTRARKRIAKSSQAIVHLHKRISFIDPDTEQPVKGNDRDSMLYIWSSKPEYKRLEANFGSLGTVLVQPSLHSKKPFFMRHLYI